MARSRSGAGWSTNPPVPINVDTLAGPTSRAAASAMFSPCVRVCDTHVPKSQEGGSNEQRSTVSHIFACETASNYTMVVYSSAGISFAALQ